MRRTSLVLAIILVGILAAFKVDKPAYVIYDSNGKEIDYSKFIKAAEEADVLFLGELHDNPVIHWLQLQITKDMHAKKKEQLVLGAEMFESDNQLILNEYLSGQISKKSFKSECRLWPNYDTDYEPLVEFAKENNLSFIASNVPRRYASMVYRGGLESLETLDKTAKSFLPPLPIEVDLELEGYKSMMAMAEGHGGENLPKAQAIKDATMGYFIAQNRKPEQYFIHYNGTYHSNNHEGTVWYLNKYQPEAKSLTVASVYQADIEKLEKENKGLADYIICVPEDMTRTY